VKQRGLTGPVVTYDGNAIAAGDRQVKVGEEKSGGIVVAIRHGAQGEQGMHAGAPEFGMVDGDVSARCGSCASRVACKGRRLEGRLREL
jgi:hypothetical protein